MFKILENPLTNFILSVLCDYWELADEILTTFRSRMMVLFFYFGVVLRPLDLREITVPSMKYSL